MTDEDALTELRLMLDLNPTGPPDTVVRAVQELHRDIDRLEAALKLVRELMAAGMINPLRPSASK